jgi:hypothetical protein
MIFILPIFKEISMNCYQNQVNLTWQQNQAMDAMLAVARSGCFE